MLRVKVELVGQSLLNTIVVIAIIGGLLFGAVWIIGFYWMRSREAESELPIIEMPAKLREVVSGVPPVLVIFYSFIAVSLVAYVLYTRFWGISF